MSTNLQGKVITITGGAAGIGLATAKMAAARGAKVSLADVQEAGLKNAVAAIEADGGKAIYAVVDVRNREQVESWISKTVATYGPLDGVVNLAGVPGKQTGAATVDDISDEDWNWTMAVNATGTLNCLRPQIKVIKDGGSIVNCASLAGVEGLEKYGSYCASKFAVVGLTMAVAKEVGPRGIRTNVIAPGPIKTAMMHDQPEHLKSSMIPTVTLGRYGEADEVSELICWLLCDGSTFVTGTVQRVDGGGRVPK